MQAVCPHCGAVNRIPPERPAKEAKCGRCHRPVFESRALPATAATFERHRTRDDIPIVVDFWGVVVRPVPGHGARL
jgi:thioredoxin 2